MTVYGLYYVADGRRELCESFWHPEKRVWECFEAHRTLDAAQKRIDTDFDDYPGNYVADAIRPGIRCYFVGEDENPVMSS